MLKCKIKTKYNERAGLEMKTKILIFRFWTKYLFYKQTSKKREVIEMFVKNKKELI